MAPPPNDWRVEALARLLCRCLSEPVDPDAVVVDLKIARRGPGATVVLDKGCTKFAWQALLPLATAIIDKI